MPDLVPIDGDPFNSTSGTANLGGQPTPKAGQTVQPINVGTDIAAMPGQVANVVGNLTGVNDAISAARGNMTPDEAQMFALGAIPALFGGPEVKTMEEAAPAIAKGIRAFHGSPYDFNAFDLSKIGTGEGAQAYGHGLYFAENPQTATAYRDSLSDLKPRSIEGNPDLTLPSWIAKKVESKNPVAINDVRTDFQNRLAEMQRQVADPNTPQPWMVESNIPGIKNILTALDHVEAGANVAPAGRMYEVNINADPDHFLDWDKPLSEHPQDVQDKVKQAMGIDYYGKYDPEKANRVWDQFGHAQAGTAVKNGFIAFGDDTTSQRLRDAGIPGIKYLDQGSRSSGDGTRNYVVFNDKLIDIVKKYGMAGLVAGGAAHFSTTPVDHDPFAAQLTPVDYNPFP